MRRKEKVVYNFCSQPDCSDGRFPNGLSVTLSGDFYGTTSTGRSNAGVVFKLSPKHKRFAETILYNFCSRTNCVDGNAPTAAPVQDTRGNLFGTTQEGGSTGRGVLYQVIPGKRSDVEVVLHTFARTVIPTARTVMNQPAALRSEKTETS
jgi:uncharacterized repeat protein (TIGR03803 family)